MENEHPSEPLNQASSFERYRVQICMGNEVIHKLAVPAHKSPFHVISYARSELAHTYTATHALVRGLSGTEIEVYAADGWLTRKLKALKLR